MTPRDLIRAATLAGIDLNVRGGRLDPVLPDDPPADLVTSIKASKPAIVTTLHMLSTNANRQDLLCLGSDVGTPEPADLDEADVWATELARTGGLGQVVNDMLHRWHELTPVERAAACHTWRSAAARQSAEHVAH